MNGNDINCGKGIIVNVDVSKFNDEVNNYVFRYGLRQMLSDVHSAVKKDEPDAKSKARALIEKKLSALYSGDFRAVSERSTMDKVESQARQMALEAVKAAVVKKGRKINTLSNTWYAEQVDKNWHKFQAQAEEIVRIRETKNDNAALDLDEMDV